MKTKQFLMIGSSMIAILLLLSACGQSPSVPPEVTLTFSGDTCAYSGPKSLLGKFNINVVVEGQGNTMYGYILVTLEEGKTIEDLQAWPSTDPPGWLKDAFHNTGPVFVEPGSVKQNIDVWVNAAYAGDPIYIVCFADAPGRKIGALGPIEITK
jgi:hypothetical protein